MNKINPLLYITDRDPFDEVALDSSKWFKTETMELNFGDYVGRPGDALILRTSTLNYLFGNGWYVDAVLGTKTGGKWKSVTSGTVGQDGWSNGNNNATSDSNATSHQTSSGGSTTSGYSASQSQGNNSSSSTSEGTGISTSDPGGTYEDKDGNIKTANPFTKTDSNTNTNGSGASSSSGSSNSGSTSDSHSSSTGGSTSHGFSNGNSHADSHSDSTTKTTQQGPPYWYAYTKLRLKRRRLQSELVLKDMINEFTKAYNEGRTINDERYDELVNLYALMLSNTEDEIGGWTLDPNDFRPLIDQILDACKDAIENFRGKVEDIPDDWMQSRIDEINRKFDALLEKARSDLITQGMYNGTVWPTTESGIERDRQLALNGLKDDMVLTKIDAYGKIAGLTADIGGKVIGAATRLCALQTEALKPTEMRNTVFKWMLDFMERREDDYPDLGQLAGISSQLGYGDGATVGAVR